MDVGRRYIKPEEDTYKYNRNLEYRPEDQENVKRE